MLCIGLTGSMGSGKSTVSRYFQDLGITVLSADHIARTLTTPQSAAWQSIVDHFGHGILFPNNEINRSQLRTIIFQDTDARRWLENLLHPLIRKEIVEQLSSLQGPYALIEIPLLTSKDNYPYLNRILLVQSTIDQQVARIMKRDQCSESLALAMLAAQPDASLREKFADDFIYNKTSLCDLKTQVKNMHAFYLSLVI